MRSAPRHKAGIECLTVGKTDPKRLQDFLAARLSLSRNSAKAVIDGRSVWVNRKCIWIARFELNTGDTVEIPSVVVKGAVKQGGVMREGEEKVSSEKRHIRVLWSDDNYLIADKPAGIVSCDDLKSVESILRVQEGIPTLEAVHRLDRDTSGCLLFAKNHASFEAAVEVFKTRGVAKTYHAIVAGCFKFAHMRIDTPLDGKEALSDVRREMFRDDASFLKVRIETGRTNQIRRHLASVRFPIVGDRVFGLKSARDPRLMSVHRQMLHASLLELPHPLVKGGTIKAHSPLPADFRSTLKMFGMGKQ